MLLECAGVMDATANRTGVAAAAATGSDDLMPSSSEQGKSTSVGAFGYIELRAGPRNQPGLASSSQSLAFVPTPVPEAPSFHQLLALFRNCAQA